ncbi:MAG: type IV secretory system conjugative DNA transfer family protein [Isosphaeraceae bacterium]
MYLLSRLMLILALVAYSFCVVFVAMGMGGLLYIGIVIVVLAYFYRRRPGVYTAYGTARWATWGDLGNAGMLGARRGPIIGRAWNDTKPSFQKAQWDLFDFRVSSQEACEEFFDAIRFFGPPRQTSALVRLPRAVHTAVFAPTGVGKGVSCVIPFLLTSGESAVVVDFKGELFAKTAEHRRRQFQHKIVVLDPFKLVSQKPDTFNPLDFIDRESPTAIDECRDLAEALVIRTGQEKEPHWADSAEAWIGALTALVVQYAEFGDRSLQTVRSVLTDPAKLEMAIKLMCASDAWSGMLARMGNQLTQYKERELSSTLTTTNRFLRFLDTLAVAENTKTSNFNPGELLGGRMTIYLLLTPEHMRAASPLLRAWIGSLLRAVVRGGLQERNLVNFILDEAASLGHLESLDDAVDKYRSYAVRLQFFYQSLGQLRKCFPEGQEQTLLSNVSQVFFGVNDLQTAEYVSNRLGEKTIVVSSGGTSKSTSRQYSSKGDSSSTSYSTNESSNWSQLGRRLLKPDEVLALSQRIAITFTPGVPPIWTTLVRYYEENLVVRQPGCWARFQAAARVAVKAFVVLFVGYWFAASLHQAATRVRPVHYVPSRIQYRIPHYRKG